MTEFLELTVDVEGTEEQIAALAKLKKIVIDKVNDPETKRFMMLWVEDDETGTRYRLASTNCGFDTDMIGNLPDYFTRLLEQLKQKLNN